MQAGRLDNRVAILRRPVADASNPGVTRGDFEIVWTCWAAMRSKPAPDVVASGVDMDATVVTLQVRECAASRAITIADKFRLNGTDYRIQAVSLPDRALHYIEITGSKILPSA